MADVATYIGKYVQLRDKVKEIQEKHKAELAPYKAAMEQLEGYFLNSLTALGTDSIASHTYGTVYRNVKNSATLFDADAFRRHVIGSEAWDLADIRANAPAVQEFMNEHDGQAPPGVTFSQFTTVGIRRA